MTTTPGQNIYTSTARANACIKLTLESWAIPLLMFANLAPGNADLPPPSTEAHVLCDMIPFAAAPACSTPAAAPVTPCRAAVSALSSSSYCSRSLKYPPSSLRLEALSQHRLAHAV
jgi:hypothetical protein